MKAVSLGPVMMAVQIEKLGTPSISIINVFPGCPIQPIDGVKNIRTLQAFCASVVDDPEFPFLDPPRAINARDLANGADLFGLDQGKLMELMGWLGVEVNP